MILKHKILWFVFFCSLTVSISFAQEVDEREELLGIKNTIVNLIDELVEAGVLDETKADLMKQRAAAKAKLQAAEEAEEEAQAKAEQQVADDEAVRVQYVPEHVKEEIRNQVRSELKEEVVAEVMDDAKQHILGVPDLLPDWVKNLRITGSFRIRNQTEAFADDIDLDVNDNGLSDGVPDFLALNATQVRIGRAEGFQNPNQFFKNRLRTRNYLRERIRLGFETDINEHMRIGMRITAGDIFNPVSVNQDLGNDGRNFDAQFDHAFLEYKHKYGETEDWLTFLAGRYKNPFFSTEMVYDRDLTFEGVALRLKQDMSTVGLGSANRGNAIFATIGAFPLDEIELSAQDKWLFGGQLGSEIQFADDSRFKMAVSYYDFNNITGRRNQAQDLAGGSSIIFQPFDFTAPTFLQGGNTMFDIRNDFDSAPTADQLADLSALYALASDFNLLNVTGSYDWAGLAPVHVIFTGDFVKNFGYDKKEILQRIREGGNGTAEVYQDIILGDPDAQLKARTIGYHFGLTAGHLNVREQQGLWQVFGGYKYLQRDAVVDAYTQSNLGLGGTNVKGFYIGGRYSIFDHAWLQGRWLSSDSIDGPDIGIDVVQFDLNARF